MNVESVSESLYLPENKNMFHWEKVCELLILTMGDDELKSRMTEHIFPLFCRIVVYETGRMNMSFDECFILVISDVVFRICCCCGEMDRHCPVL